MSRGRAANGQGSVRKRATSRGEVWDAQASAKEAGTGRSRRVTKRGFKTQREAIDWCKKVSGSARPTVSGSNTRVSDAVDEYWATGFTGRPGTKSSYSAPIRALARNMKGKRMRALTVKHIEAVVNANNPAKATAASRASALRGFIGWAEQQGITEPELTRQVGQIKINGGPPKRRRPATAAEVQAVINAGSEHALMWETMAGTGIRPGEARTLTAQSVLSPTRLWVDESGGLTSGSAGPTKSGKGRPVGMPRSLGVKLIELAEKVPDGPLFGKMSRATIISRLEADCKKAGIARLTPHQFRHYWATTAFRAGVHPRVVQEQLGHSSMAVTMDVYTAVAGADLESAANAVSGIASKTASAEAGQGQVT